ncbi:MAG TPA: mandelate racemase, partial [Jatrophihabitans sp.]|nr:mandelate racemase [Jatrophihabitans sp.]
MSARIEAVSTAVYRFPTPEPEADGTLQWDATTAVSVTLSAGGRTGLGWTYSSPAAAELIKHHLVPAIGELDAFDIAGRWEAMRRACRNLGSKGLVMQAISALDIAGWDLKARLLDVSLGTLLGRCRDIVPIYGSGGFTTLSDAQLAEQVGWWRSVGCTAMKIKIGESWGTEIER